MKRNFKIGLILGIALLMLLPVYARAQMSFNFQNGSGGSAGVSVGNITATQGETIIFTVTCPSPSAQFSMILNPDPPPGGAASFTSPTFTWPTGANGSISAVPPGSYTAVFQASYGTDVDQLVVMIAINNPPTGGGGGSTDTTPPTVTAFSLGTPNSLTVPINSFTATDNVLVTGYMVTQSSTNPTASAQGWSATAPTSYTFPAGTAAGSYTLYAWAKDAAGNVSTGLSASVTITLPSGGGGTGTYSQLVATAVPLNKNICASGAYGYINSLYCSSSSDYILPKGQTAWFLIDPVGFNVPTTKTQLNIFVLDYRQGVGTGLIDANLYCIDNSGNLLWEIDNFIAEVNQGSVRDPYWKRGVERFLIKVKEQGKADTPFSVYWGCQ